MPVIQRIITPGRAHKSLTLEVLGGVRAEDRGGQSLRNNLLAFWPSDEASGNLIDAHSNGLDLTETYSGDSGPIGYDTGLVYDTARLHEGEPWPYHYFTRPSESLLNFEGYDFTVAMWVKFDGTISRRSMVIKGDSTTPREWELYQFNPYFHMIFSTGSISALNLQPVAADVWYLVIAWLNSSTGDAGIQVNNGTPDTAIGCSVTNTSNSFIVGKEGSQLVGLQGPVMVWKSAPAQGGVLSAAMRETLWNYGAGLQYLDLAEALTPPPDWWFFYNRDAEAAYQPLGADDYEDSLLDLTANDNDIPTRWWELLPNATGAWQPLGAADLAASYTDITGNGNDANPIVAPGWSASAGWTYAAGIDLDSGVIVTKDNFTIICRWYCTSSHWGDLMGRASPPYDVALSGYNTGTSKMDFRKGGIYGYTPVASSGVIGISGDKAWFNGEILSSAIGTSAGVPVNSIKWGPGIYGAGWQGGFTVQAAIIAANYTATDEEMVAIMAAMAALTEDSVPPSGTSPTWASGTGWTFDGVDEYLEPGITADDGWSMMVSIDNGELSGSNGVAGGAHTGHDARFYIYNYHTTDRVVYGNGLSLVVTPSIASGVLGIAGDRAYRNGVQETGVMGAWAGAPNSIFIGAVNWDGTPAVYKGDIPAIAIYPNVLPSEMATELSDRMAVVGVAYKLETLWTGNEIIGNRFDLVSGQLLTASGSPSSAEGHIYDRARLYERIDLDYHSAPDSAALSMAGTDFTILAWVYLFDYDDDAYIIYKGGTNPTDREYDLGFVKATSLFKFSVKGTTGVAKSVSATSYGAVPLNTWVHITAWYDDTAQTISIQVDNGVIDSVSHTKGVRENMGSFYMSVNAALNAYWDGMIGPVAMLKSLLTEHERDALWNAGRGRKIRG